MALRSSRLSWLLLGTLALIAFCSLLHVGSAYEENSLAQPHGVERKLLSREDDEREKEKREKEKKDKEDKNKDGKGQPGCEGDPHFTGADSSHFDFSGVPNNTYCVLSDSHLHINAFFGGYYGKYENNPSKSITWMRKIGVLWGHNSILFEAREGAEAEYGSGYMSRIQVNGEDVAFSNAGEKATFVDGRITVSWVAAKEASGDELIDVYALDIKGVVSMILELRPEMPHFRTETDGTVHFDIYFPIAYLSDNSHGILGQTFRSDHKDRISKIKLEYNERLDTFVVPGDNGEGYLDGKVEDYQTPSILAPECKVNRFTRAEVLDSETALAVEMASGGVPSVLGEAGSTIKMTAGSSTYRRMRRLKLMKRLRLM